MNWSSLRDLARSRADHRPEQQAFCFLPGDGSLGPTLTHGELDRRARAIAAVLVERAAPGARALLLYPTGLEFIAAFFGCAYAGLIAVPVPPPEPRRSRRTLARLRAVAADATPALALTTGDVLAATAGDRAGAPELATLPWIATDALESAQAAVWCPRGTASSEAVAYLQYTSGSTASPKGVMVTNGNAHGNSEAIRRAWGYGPESVALMWVPNFHDDGLVHGIVQPLHSGCTSYLMSPASVVERPGRWLAAIGQVRATHSGGPNFAYALCVRRIAAAERAALDLASWRVAYNAAEPIRAETLDSFCRAFAPHGFRREAFAPAFGLAEATLLVTTRTGKEPALLTVATEALARQGRAVPVAGGGEPARTLVGCGAAVPGTKVAIAHPENAAECAPGEVGEIWIQGPGVARGYWRQEAATAETFGAHLAGSGEGPFLRTGDLGFLDQGELYVSGRLKDLIIIHGRNHFPHDIELTVERSSPRLRPGCGAAVPIEVDGEERLAIVHEAEGDAELDIPALAAQVCRDVAEAHELQVHTLVLIRPRTIPKTSSGKLQRRACRAELAAGTLDEVGRWTVGRPAEHAPRAAGDEPGADGAPGAEPAAAEAVSWLRDWAPGRLDSRRIDERRSIPPSVVLDLGERGLFGLQMATGLGGLGLSHRGAATVLAQLGAIDLTLACLVAGHNSLGLRPLVRWATPAARAELLPDLARGRTLAAFALSEPGAGSNPRALAARAVPAAAGGWRLSGTKRWIGSAAWARAIHVFARVPAAGGSAGGITGFLVRQGAPGLRIGPEALTMGLRGMVQNEVHLDDVPAAGADLLGAVGGGMEVATDAIDLSRCLLGAVALGGIRRCAQLAARFAERRAIAGGRLLDHPVARTRLGEMSVAATAVGCLLEWVMAARDAGRTVPPEATAVLKTAGAELLWRAADAAMQLLGGRGYVESNLVPQILRDARVFRIFEGPTEVLHQFVGSSILHGGGLTPFLLELPAGERIAARLAAVAGELREQAVRLPAAERTAARHWACHRLGEMAAAGLLLAAVDAAEGHSTARRRAAEWAQLRFEEETRQALGRGPEDAARFAAAEVELLAGDLAAAIGELEQAAAGERQDLDLLLRIPAPAAMPTIPEAPTRSDRPAPAPRRGAGPSVEEVRHWLGRWLEAEVGVAPDALDPAQPFAALGLDSITATRLAAELAAWLGRPVARTAAWDFPSVEARARQLAGDESAEDGAVLAEPVPAPTAAASGDDELLALLAGVESLSPEEIRRELGSELGRPQRHPAGA